MLKQISADAFTKTTAIDGVAVFHKTQEEPDTFAFGSTIVSAFQVARFHNGGADDIGWATSSDGGKSWKHGFFPGWTFQGGGRTIPHVRVRRASVAVQARHKAG